MNFRNIGRQFVSMNNIATTAKAAGTGTAGAAAAQFLAERFEPLRRHWWSTPLGMLIAGHGATAVGAKTAGPALAGAAGSTAYWLRRLSKGAASTETTGIQDTGLLDDDYDGALRSLPETTGIQDSPRMSSTLSQMSVAG